jgi:hydantoinase/carbamoylase family amidase
MLGVLAGLEVLAVMNENNVIPLRAVELVVFTEEEGTNFGTTMLGSKAMAGKVDFDYLQKLSNEDGKSAVQVMKEAGFEPERVAECRADGKEIFGMIELHIEQGIVLEQKQMAIGIVEAICGMSTYRVDVQGTANHAGSTPMDMRQDALLAAAKLIVYIGESTKKEGHNTTVATVGEIHCKPNVSNVIPSSVCFNVDVRDIREDGIEAVSVRMKKKSKEIEISDNVQMEISVVGCSDVVSLSDTIICQIEKASSNRTKKYMRMPSGAVHDAAMMAEMTDVGMIFIPSIGGVSHAPSEASKTEDISLGAKILLDVVLSLTAPDYERR